MPHSTFESIFVSWGPSICSTSIMWVPATTITVSSTKIIFFSLNWSFHIPAIVLSVCLQNHNWKWLIWKLMPSLEWALIKSDLNLAGIAQEAASLHFFFLEALPTWRTSGCGAPVWPCLSESVRFVPGEMASVLKGYSCLRRHERGHCVCLPPKPPSAVCHQKWRLRPYLATDRNGFQTFPGKSRYLASCRWFVIPVEVRF